MSLELLVRAYIMAQRLAGEAEMAQFWSWSGSGKETPKEAEQRMSYAVRKHQQATRLWQVILHRSQADTLPTGWIRWGKAKPRKIVRLTAG